jgi:DNA polymerase I-like protein with 3'-5' exonuclease and polymerase domains
MMITRNCLYPRLGNLLMEADYKQVEVGISACYHKDPTMLKYIKENGDMHKDVAIQIFGIKNFDKHIYGHKTLRKAAKNGFVFPQFYGDYYKPCAKSLACGWGNLPEGKWKKGQGTEFEDGVMLSDHMISLGINSLEKFTEHIRKIEKHFWEKRFPIYQKWKEDMWKKYQVKGYVDLFTGFRCGGLMDKKNVGNYPIQGAASHCLLWSFIRVTQLLEEKNMQTKLICQIHDALILDIYPPELEEVQKMVNYVMCVEVKEVWDWIIVPLAVEFDVGEIDKSWAYLGSD